MANKPTTKNNHPAPQGETKKPQNNPFRVLLLSALGFAALLFVLQQFGIKSVYRSETTARIDHNSAEYQNRAMPQMRAAQANPVVEQTVQELAREFDGTTFSDIKSANQQKGWGLSDDQAHYYDQIRTQAQKNGKSDADWLNRIRAANAIYQTVYGIFANADMKTLAQPSAQSDAYFQKLQQKFGVSVTDSRNFAPRAQSVSDWAAFVERMQHQ